jgi:hypothetical protein
MIDEIYLMLDLAQFLNMLHCLSQGRYNLKTNFNYEKDFLDGLDG